MFYFRYFICNASSETGKPPLRNLEKTVLKELGSKLKKKIHLEYIPAEKDRPGSYSKRSNFVLAAKTDLKSTM